MKIAVEGCTHGELERIYETIAELEKQNGFKVHLLLCCGDFQATRNLSDLKCMAVPDKYKEMGSFYKYYSGEKTAPILTVFIGGNHEASNHLQELPYGGWVAENIYYLGYANVIRVNGIRIGGLSGIFKGADYLIGHHEAPPYDQSSLRSVYHIRNLEIFRLKQLAEYPPDVMVSHDWPRGVHNYGNLQQLLRMKRHFEEDISRDCLGSRPTRDVLDVLKPKYWFSAHLHVKFPAVIKHDVVLDEDDENSEDKEDVPSVTKFLALDKCLPGRKFLQILEIGNEVSNNQVKLEYDPHWLAILKSTNHLLSVERFQNHMPGPLYNGRYDFKPAGDEIKEIEDVFNQDFIIPSNFVRTATPYDRNQESVRDLYRTMQPTPQRNPQTLAFCQKLGIQDPVEQVIKGKWVGNEVDETSDPSQFEPENNANETSDFPTFVETRSQGLEDMETSPKTSESEKEDPSSPFTIDPSPNTDNAASVNSEKPRRTLKRRNQAIYSQDLDEG